MKFNLDGVGPSQTPEDISNQIGNGQFIDLF